MKFNNSKNTFAVPVRKVKKFKGNPVRAWKRFIAAFMAYFLILQICLPSVAIAATMLSNDDFSQVLKSPLYRATGKPGGAMYARPGYLQVDTQSGVTIANAYTQLSPTQESLPDTTLVIGDEFVQQRLIRAQLNLLLARSLIDKAGLLLNATTKKAFEQNQNDELFAAGIKFGLNTSKKFGTPLTPQDTITNNMIWPEKRTINGTEVIIPVVYLNSATLATKPEGHYIQFGLSTAFNDLEIHKGVVISALGNENYQTVINSINNIKNAGTINGSGNLELIAGNMFLNVSGQIKATNNLDIRTTRGDVINKTLVLPYQSKDGSGTRLAAVATLDSATGNIKITSGKGITYEGGTSNALFGALTLDAYGDLVLAPVATNSQSTTTEGNWVINKSSFELMQSKLTAKQMLTLIAGGSITMTASELHSTEGGIELLAKHGIYIADEQGHFQSNRVDKIGRTTGTGSDFESFAIRSVLSAGKGILLETNTGAVELKGAKITSSEGTQIKATNGKVRLLITKENSQHYLDTVRKGNWTIKTVHEEYVKETGIPNAIVGGLAVEALLGVDIEYAGREGANLKDQIDEYKKMPDTMWMADIYEGRTLFKNAQGNLVPLNQIVDFSKVTEAYTHIRNVDRSLSPAAMALLTIVIAVASGGASLSGQSFLSSAMSAGFTTLEVQAASSLLAGNSIEQTLKNMSSSESLKNLAISMATAGALSALDEYVDLEFFDKAQVKETPQLAFVNQAYQAVTHSVVTAGVSVTINGGNSEDYRNAFKQTLATYAVNTIGQKLTDKISNSTTLNEASKYIAHAAMGCLTQGLTAKLSDADFKDACPSGAGGAVVAQVAVDILESKATGTGGQILSEPNKITPTNIGSTLGYLGANGVDLSKFLAGIIAFAAGGDVNAAAASAGMTAQSYKESLEKIAHVGSVMHGMGLVGCKSNDVVLCGANAAEIELRTGLKALGYSDSAIEAEVTAQRNLGIFASIGEFNKLYLNDKVLNNMSGREVTGGWNNEEYIANKERMAGLSSKVVEYTGKANIRIEQVGDIARDSVKVLLDEPILAPLKSTIAYTGKKGAELAKAAIDAIPGASEALDAKEKLEEGIGTGAVAYLYGNSFETTDETNKDPRYKNDLEAHSSKGITWIVVTVVGVVASGYSIYKYLDVGKDKFDGDKILDLGSWGEKRVDPKPGALKGQPKDYLKEKDPQKSEGFRLENESADILSKHGFDVEQLPEGQVPKGMPDPDLKFNGEFADVYSPNTDSITSVQMSINDKVNVSKQAQVIVVNLSRAKGDFTANDVYKIIYEKPVPNLKALYVIKNGVVYMKSY